MKFLLKKNNLVLIILAAYRIVMYIKRIKKKVLIQLIIIKNMKKHEEYRSEFIFIQLTAPSKLTNTKHN